jgi:hypothetical protein
LSIGERCGGGVPSAVREEPWRERVLSRRTNAFLAGRRKGAPTVLPLYVDPRSLNPSAASLPAVPDVVAYERSDFGRFEGIGNAVLNPFFCSAAMAALLVDCRGQRYRRAHAHLAAEVFDENLTSQCRLEK